MGYIALGHEPSWIWIQIPHQPDLFLTHSSSLLPVKPEAVLLKDCCIGGACHCALRLFHADSPVGPWHTGGRNDSLHLRGAWRKPGDSDRDLPLGDHRTWSAPLACAHVHQRLLLLAATGANLHMERTLIYAMGRHIAIEECVPRE